MDTTSSVLERLQASADRLAQLDEETHAERERHAKLITSARDEGHSWRAIARAARRSLGRCHEIYAGN